jgi:hypothetical protein
LVFRSKWSWKIDFDENLTTYITADEGTATVNGQNVNTNQKPYNFLLGAQAIRCIWICMFVNI